MPGIAGDVIDWLRYPSGIVENARFITLQMKTLFKWTTALGLALAVQSAGAGDGIIQRGNYVEREDVKTFINKVVSEYGLDKQSVRAVLAQATRQDRVLELIARPAEFKPWKDYRPIFVTSKRIDKGVIFYQENRDILQRAATEFGVPAEIIAAIIGVETYYGTRMGNTSVLDSLVTLGFDYPPRATFFRGELGHLLALANEENIDPLEVKGSYAGAIGMGQFIPSSYRHYAIDYDADGQRDLRYNVEDAIGSVANYFKRHGWKTDAPVIGPAKVVGKGYESLKPNSRKPGFTSKQLKAAGISGKSPIEPNEKLVYLKLKGEYGDEHWVGHHNFYVITQYNHSVKYAMAVYQLSQAIKEAVDAQG